MFDKARDFATEYHTYHTRSGVPDTYDGKPYVETHVASVVKILEDFSGSLFDFGITLSEYNSLLVAAWLHDTVEDTHATIRQVARTFGLKVARLVWPVTGVGDTRKIRNADMARKIEKYPLSAILKCADRISNVEHSTKGSKHHTMYAKEMDSFATYIKPNVPEAMWQRLVDAF